MRRAGTSHHVHGQIDDISAPHWRRVAVMRFVVGCRPFGNLWTVAEHEPSMLAQRPAEGGLAGKVSALIGKHGHGV